jgi:putative hemolysin
MSEPPSGGFGVNIFFSALLLLASALFVSAEYALVSARKSRLESLAKKGNKTARGILSASADLSPFIAGTQIGITMVGIAIGSFVEPFITDLIVKRLDGIDGRISQALSFIIVLFVLLVLGELVPKYIALAHPERLSMFLFSPLKGFVWLFKPVIILAQKCSYAILKILRINTKPSQSDTMVREELLMLLQSTAAEGILEKEHAVMVNKALRLDSLDARDIMVHRLDMKWIDSALTAQEALLKISQYGHTRVPVCRADVDDLIGIVYMVDIVRNLQSPNFKLEQITRPAVIIPENLKIERIVQTMRDEKTQMVIVLDEYGGTSGLISLEDVVEEVFGELEDGPESERPTIEVSPKGRVSARAEVRLDELVEKLNLNIELQDRTETLANIITSRLERIARPGDKVETEIGLMRVENMARRRITRVGIQIRPELLNPAD